MRLWDYLSGGNAKVAAGSIARAHRRYRGDYHAVYNEFIARINAGTDWGEPHKSLEINFAILTVKNYTDLGVLYIYTGALPGFANLDNIRQKFAPELSWYLRGKGIPEQFILGVNI